MFSGPCRGRPSGSAGAEMGGRLAGGRAALGPLTAVRQGDSSPGPPLGARIACGEPRLAARDGPFREPGPLLAAVPVTEGPTGAFRSGEGNPYRFPVHDARTTCRGCPHAVVPSRALATRGREAPGASGCPPPGPARRYASLRAWRLFFFPQS